MYNKSLGEIMARISSQAAVDAVGNRYDLVLIAAQRARELARGHQPLVDKRGSHTTTALREIEKGLIGRDYLYKKDDYISSSHHRRTK